MTGHKIITIGREFGSGGHEIGQKLADRLGIPLYDNRLVSMAAEELGVKTEDAERVDESSLNTFVTRLYRDTWYVYGVYQCGFIPSVI